jgi:AraC-like DNA-binding protein
LRSARVTCHSVECLHVTARPPRDLVRSAHQSGQIRQICGSQHMDATLQNWRDDFIERLAQPLFVEALFDRQPDLVFSVKDRVGRYVAISEACAERCNLPNKRHAIGKTAHDLFPKHMADRYVLQDEAVFQTRQPVVDNLDLTLFNDRKPGWCLTNKIPLQTRDGDIIGLACLSRDLLEPSKSGIVDQPMANAVDRILHGYAEPLRIEQLAETAEVSLAQFERRMKRIFQLSAGQFIIKTRITAATARLEQTEDSISEIALACGFCDQSALSKQFRQITGLSPKAYRDWKRKTPGSGAGDTSAQAVA